MEKKLQITKKIFKYFHCQVIQLTENKADWNCWIYGIEQCTCKHVNTVHWFELLNENMYVTLTTLAKYMYRTCRTLDDHNLYYQQCANLLINHHSVCYCMRTLTRYSRTNYMDQCIIKYFSKRLNAHLSNHLRTSVT